MKFVITAHMGGAACFQKVSHAATPYPTRRAPASPEFLGAPTRTHRVKETTTKFCMIKLDVREIFTGSTHKCWCAICLANACLR